MGIVGLATRQRQLFGLLVAGLLPGLAGFTFGAMNERTLVIYDLTPTAAIDAKDAVARRRAWDEQHLVSALQGLANREQPRLYVYFVGQSGATDRWWLKALRDEGEWIPDWKLDEERSLEALIQRFADCYRGLVVWDERVPATALLASTIAGCEELLPVRYDATPGSLYQRLSKSIPVKVRLINADGSPMFKGKCDATRWGVEHYLKSGKSNPLKIGYYPDAWWLAGKTRVPADRTLLVNHDYFIADKAFFCDLSPWEDEAPDDDPDQRAGDDHRALIEVLRAASAQAKGQFIHVGGFTPWDQKYTDHTGRKHGGVPTEWHFAQILSCFNAYMDADAPGLHAMANASVFQHAPLKAVYEQKKPPRRKVENKKYVTIYVGDYDSAAWLYQQAPSKWEDPVRGTIPLGWAFNPALAQRFAAGMDWLRRHASESDFFVAGDSGYGYINPGYLDGDRKFSGLPPAVEGWEKLCAAGYRQWGLSISGFVIDGYAPAMSDAVKSAYARFSPDGVVAQKIPPQSLVDGVPFLRMNLDLSNPEEGAQAICNAMTRDGRPGFAIFRTILWTPTQHARLFNMVRAQRDDIEIVDPYTLMQLLRDHLAR